MANAKRQQRTTKTQPEAQKQQPVKNDISKMEAVRQALSEHGLDAKPVQILEFVKTRFGVKMSPSMVSNYKSTLTKKMAGPKRKGRRSTGNATPSKASPARRQASISMDDLASLKQLVDRLGASRISELTHVLGD